ncbi:MAG: TMEM165/GDT1 family protein [Myxococcota bacterium]
MLASAAWMSVFFIAYSTVLVAELLGDKTLYTLAALATRFRAAPIVAGAALAFSLKMAAAVLLGHVISHLPEPLLSVLSGVTFFAMALGIFLQWRAEFRGTGVEVPQPPKRFSAALLTSFVAIFVPEWGDPGQLAAALLVAQGKSGLLVWAAGTLAMTTKAVLSAALGLGLRRFVPQSATRLASVFVFIALGFLALFHVEL